MMWIILCSFAVSGFWVWWFYGIRKRPTKPVR